MQCADFLKQRDDYLDKQLSDLECAAMEDHLEHCTACRAAFAEDKAMREALRNIPVPDAQAGFAARALRRAAAANAVSHQRGRKHAFAGGFAAALVAGIVLWLVSGVYDPSRESGTTQTQLAEVTISLHETRRVSLSFNAPEDMEKVRVSLFLPENVELEGYPGRHQIAWFTRLQKGNNILTLPLSALRSEKGLFTVKIGTGEAGQQLQFYLNVAEPGLSTLEAPKTA